MFGWLRDLLKPKALREAGVIPPFLDHPAGSKAANDQIRAVLAQYDDDGSAPRHVVHHAYPKDEHARDKGTARRVIGWKMSQFTNASSEEGLVFEEIRDVASEAFDAATDKLRRDLEEIGWVYDGWESAVVAEEDET